MKKLVIEYGKEGDDGGPIEVIFDESENVDEVREDGEVLRIFSKDGLMMASFRTWVAYYIVR